MNQRGFTLVELMFVVAIIGVLSVVMIPQMSNAIRRAHESTTKGNLATMREALTMYSVDHEGLYPQDNLTSLITFGYLKEIPLKSTPPYHPDGNSVSAGDEDSWANSRGDWYYDNVPGDPLFGKVWVDCDHMDLKGNRWTTY